MTEYEKAVTLVAWEGLSAVSVTITPDGEESAIQDSLGRTLAKKQTRFKLSISPRFREQDGSTANVPLLVVQTFLDAVFSDRESDRINLERVISDYLMKQWHRAVGEARRAAVNEMRSVNNVPSETKKLA